LLCSTGAFSRDPDLTDHRAVLRYGPGLAVDGFEVIFYADWYGKVERIAADLTSTGFSFPVVHAEKSIGAAVASYSTDDARVGYERLAENCLLAKMLGARFVVLHLWAYPDSTEVLERDLRALPPCLDVAEMFGLGLAVETVPSAASDALAMTQRAMERDGRCLVALDTEFLAYHGQLDAALGADWLWEGGRMRHAHIKDYDGEMFTPDNRRRYLHPGEGDIPFARFFSGLSDRGFEGAVSLEATVVGKNADVDAPRLIESIATLRKLTNSNRKGIET
jgi:sugar phosphate isomerase/epimerase